MSAVARVAFRPPGPRSAAAERDRRRRAWRRPLACVGLSLAFHAAMLLVPARPEPEPTPPPPRVMELALVAPGDHEEQGALPAQAPDPAPPTQRVSESSPTPSGSPPVSQGRVAPPAPGPSPYAAQPAPPTSSFQAWQQGRRSRFLPKAAPIGRGGSPGGTDLAQQRGYDRCVPPSHRQADLLFLLFDASGSMTGMGRAQALSCAQQYATSSLDRGATVIVGSFARETVFAPPTRQLLDIQASLRSALDATATILPSVELEPLLAQAPGATADLVIVSDGWFVASPEIMNWYRYFLDLNPDNRATMYTVGVQGQRDAVARMRAVGFEVFVYDQVRGVAPP